MADAAKLKLSLDSGGFGQVSLNGMDIGNFTSAIEFRCSADRPNEVKLTIVAEVEAEVMVALNKLALATESPAPQVNARQGFVPLKARQPRL